MRAEIALRVSKMAVLTIVAAIARNGALGLDNKIPWRAPSDLKRFKAVTWGRPLIMGRKTFESIGKPLPGRETLVVTRNPAFFGETPPEHARTAPNFEDALAQAHKLAAQIGVDEIILAGGAELYKIGLPQAQKLRLTLVDCAPQADAFFPAYESAQWRETSREIPQLTERDEVGLTYVDYARI